MKRRNFVKTSLLTGSLTAIVPQLSAAANNIVWQNKVNPEYYELRTYTLKNEAQQKIVEDYFQKAAIPALNKLGSKNIGVFTEQQPQGANQNLRYYSF